jgi:hypothetical protein
MALPESNVACIFLPMLSFKSFMTITKKKILPLSVLVEKLHELLGKSKS